jgi:hypothetical protein
LSWIARRRRVEGSILGWEVRGLFRKILGSGESYIVAAW